MALGVLVISLGTLRLTRTHQVRAGVRRAQLAGLARLQGSSALQELVAELARDLNRPEAPAFAFLRERLVGDWRELDLTTTLPRPEIEWQPSWGRVGEDAARGRIFGEILGHSARVHAPRAAPDPAGSEDLVAVVTLGVDVRVRDAHGVLTRHLEESYELRATLVAPPRPFDQLGLFVGDLDSLTDRERVAAGRRDLLERAARIRADLAARDTSGWSPELASYFARIPEGMPTAEELAARVPELPAGPAALTGFDHVADVPLDDMDLAAALGQDLARIDELERAYRTAGSGPAAAQAITDAAYALASELSNAADRVWQYQRVTRVVPHDGEFRRDFGPFLARLEPAYWLARAHLAGTPAHPDLAGWLAGAHRLEGVLDATQTPGTLRLAGSLKGRVALLVGPGGARLEDVRVAAGDRLVVVSLGGDVEVSGDCRAAVLMLPRAGSGPGAEVGPPGRLDLPGGATLRGGLYVPSGPVALQGTLVPDAALLAPWPPAATVHEGGAGSYVLALDPRPLWGAGEAR